MAQSARNRVAQRMREARSRTGVRVVERDHRSGACVAAGCVHTSNGYAQVGAASYRLPKQVGDAKGFGRRIKRIARKLARSRAMRNVAEAAADVGTEYVQAGLRVPTAVADVALRAATASAEERRSAERAARGLLRSLDRRERERGTQAPPAPPAASPWLPPALAAPPAAQSPSIIDVVGTEVTTDE